jgi:alpha,alpha-trehalose phosphorylase
MDLHDLEHNTRDGVHIASLAGSWLAAVAGFGGMRDHDGFLSFAPKLPARLERLAFGLRFRGRLLKVEATKTEATYSLDEGKQLEIAHYGDRIKVSRQKPVTRVILPTVPDQPAPTQPPGREPMARQPDAKRRRRRSGRGGTKPAPR